MTNFKMTEKKIKMVADKKGTENLITVRKLYCNAEY